MEKADNYEDLRAFERRLTEVVSSYRPLTLRWRIILSLVTKFTIIGACSWLGDPRTTVVPLTQSLWSHPMFSVAALSVILLVVLGKHKLIFAEKVIAKRTNEVLRIYNMGCDHTGKLRLRSRRRKSKRT